MASHTFKNPAFNAVFQRIQGRAAQQGRGTPDGGAAGQARAADMAAGATSGGLTGIGKYGAGYGAGYGGGYGAEYRQPMGSVKDIGGAGDMVGAAGVAGGVPSTETERMPGPPQGTQAQPGAPGAVGSAMGNPLFRQQFIEQMLAMGRGTPHNNPGRGFGRGGRFGLTQGPPTAARVGMGSVRKPGVIMQSPDGMETQEVPAELAEHFIQKGARRLR